MQKGFAPIIFLVGIMLAVLVGGGTFYVGRMTAPKIPQPQNNVIISETPKISPTLVVDQDADTVFLNKSPLFPGYTGNHEFSEPETATALVQDGSYAEFPDPDLYQLRIAESFYLFAKSRLVDLKQYLGKVVKIHYREVKGNIWGEQQFVLVDSIEPAEGRKIKLFYYNKNNDPKGDCLSEAVTSVDREIFITKTPIQDTIRFLAQEHLTKDEKEVGFSSEQIPYLLGANLQNGILTLDFPEIPSITTGGSCSMGLARAQIEKTAKQFPEVKEVRYKNPNLFQP